MVFKIAVEVIKGDENCTQFELGSGTVDEIRLLRDLLQDPVYSFASTRNPGYALLEIDDCKYVDDYMYLSEWDLPEWVFQFRVQP